ncbi:MAG: prolyl oligopeptidase family serine peptidase [Micropepsaceae bacterium]
MMPFGQSTGTTPQTATSTTPGLAIDRKQGFPPYAMMKGTMLIAPHGAKRTDYYFWMNEKNTEKVVRYLEEENKYSSEATSHTTELQNTVRAEIKARAGARPGTPPFRDDGYWYYERFSPGSDYPVIARRKGTMAAPEEILVDGAQEGNKHDQFSVGHYTSTGDGAVFGYTVDYEGDRWFTLVLKDTRTGGSQQIKYVGPGFAFASDNKSVFYLRRQAGTGRAYRLMKHVIATDPKTDKTVFEEKDSRFDLSLKVSKSGQTLLLTSSQTDTSEVYFVDASKPDAKWSSIRSRSSGVLYEADEAGGQFYINTSLNAPDRRIVTAPLAQPAQWTELVPTQRGAWIQGFEVVGGVVALEMWSNGYSQIKLHNIKSGTETTVTPEAATGYMSFSDQYTFPGVRNTDPSATTLRYGFSSPSTPDVIIDLNVATGAKKEVQRFMVPGFTAGNYVVEQSFIASAEGKQIPVTLAYRKDKFEKGKSAAVVLGYGSYGEGNKPAFNIALPSLMDRGFLVAYAHVRGGREMGDAWYQEGRLRLKKNSFQDFITVAEYLGKNSLADPRKIFAMGHSAGGLLMGAVANMKPDLFKGIVATVPNVDLLSNMLDDSLPHTTFQYDEWGNPGEPGDYEFIQSYSPYDQVDRRAYPAMLVTASYNDGEVGYYGPAKWVAKMRRLKTDQNLLLFRTNMTAGHDGETGRLAVAEEASFIDAFMLDQAGLNPGNKPGK